jgi:hypothetical protein
LFVYSRVHSKTLVVRVNGETVYSSDAPEKTRVFEFFPILSFRPGKDMLIQGLVSWRKSATTSPYRDPKSKP